MDKAKRLTAMEIRLTRLEGHQLPDRVALLEDALQAVLDDAEFETGCADMPEHAPSVPRPPTVGEDYRFFLRTSGYNDHPCLWRAFLAGRMTG